MSDIPHPLNANFAAAVKATTPLSQIAKMRRAASQMSERGMDVQKLRQFLDSAERRTVLGRDALTLMELANAKAEITYVLWEADPHRARGRAMSTRNKGPQQKTSERLAYLLTLSKDIKTENYIALGAQAETDAIAQNLWPKTQSGLSDVVVRFLKEHKPFSII